MKKTLLLFIASSLPMLLSGQVKTTDSGFSASVRGVDVKVEFYTPDIVRVFKTSSTSDLSRKKDFVVVLEPQSPKVQVINGDGSVTARSSALEVSMDLTTGKIQFNSLSGERILSEQEYGVKFVPVQFVQRIRPQRAPQQAASGTKTVTPTQSSPGHDTPGMQNGGPRTITENTNEVTQSFILDEDEFIYGLGQHQSGLMNQRGQRLNLEQNNMEIAIPYFASVKGYGVYWDSYSITRFDDTRMGTSFTSEASEAVDYYFLYGGDGDRTIALLRQLTGKARQAPLWTFGFWQCKERYKSADEVVEVASKYRSLGVPLDAVIQDWKYWGEDNADWNSLGFNNPAFSNYGEMFASLAKLNAKMMISVWPSVGENTAVYKDLSEIGAVYPMQTSPKEAKVYDVWNPKAKDIFWDYMNRNLFQPGMSAWWLDGPEPEFYNTTPGDFNLQTAQGPLRNIRNTYPLWVSKNIYESQRATSSDKRVYILTRSAFAGIQRYGAGSWSGDVRASWDVFRKQIPAGLNFSICGIPYWNTDIGAWHPYGNVYNTANTDPGYQEFYCRWFQFAVFNPMMRAHGTGSPREIYQFGERGYWAFDVQEKFINLRYSLLPYLYSTAWEVTRNDFSFMRQLSLEAPDDRNTYDISDEFMFGHTFLVAPVLEDGTGENRTVAREVYLPAGSNWIDFWTNEKQEGGRSITRMAPIDILPLYVKAGSIVPFTTEKVQYSTEKKWKKLEIRIYPGEDASFVLYEDEFDNYNYENGAYTEIPITWDDSTRTLTIEDRTGSYEGMLKNRTFVLTIAGENTAKTVSYKGRRISFAL